MMLQTSTLVLVGLALAFLAVASEPPATQPNLAEMLPAEVRGWTPEGPDGLYAFDTLYELIDGGAEVYRSFNVRSVLSRRYGKEDAPEIMVDLFDMGSSQDAFGAYHHDMREGRGAGVGHESEWTGGNLAFWKDRFFVSIVPFDDTEEVREAVLDVARTIADAIPHPGQKPDLVGLLPHQGLIGSQVHYFHDWQLLNHHFFFASENLLRLDRQTEGVLARYRPGEPGVEDGRGSSPFLLLVRYPSAAGAAEARQRFLKGYLPAADSSGVSPAPGAGWAGVRVMDDLLVGVFGASSRKHVLELMDRVHGARHR